MAAPPRHRAYEAPAQPTAPIPAVHGADAPAPGPVRVRRVSPARRPPPPRARDAAATAEITAVAVLAALLVLGRHRRRGPLWADDGADPRRRVVGQPGRGTDSAPVNQANAHRPGLVRHRSRRLAERREHHGDHAARVGARAPASSSTTPATC